MYPKSPVQVKQEELIDDIVNACATALVWKAMSNDDFDALVYKLGLIKTKLTQGSSYGKYSKAYHLEDEDEGERVRALTRGSHMLYTSKHKIIDRTGGPECLKSCLNIPQYMPNKTHDTEESRQVDN